MRPAIFITFLALLCLSLPASFAFSRTSTSTRVPSSTWSDFISRDRPEDETGNAPRLNASAVATTVVLNSSKFDSGAACTANSWTSVDLTQQTGDWWHVDTFAQAPWGGTSTPQGITFSPIQDGRSMWMAAVPPTGGPVNTVLCGYVTLPGYGNSWTQSFCSKACQSTSGGPTSNLDVAFRLKFDTEPSYDGTVLEYTTDCTGNTGWTEIDGGPNSAGWCGAGTVTVAESYAVGPGPVKVRLHFTSDTSWSDQDGLYNGFGVAVDSLTWEGLPVEDFENQPVGSHSSLDWQSCNTPGFGNYMALFKKVSGANYEDQCLNNFGCYWAAIFNSTEFYSCGSPSQPSQKVVPHHNTRGEYIANEIWSPNMTFSGSGSEFRLRYTVYRDLPLDNLVFHTWRVRTLDAGGCPGAWKESGDLLYGDSKDWAVVEHSIGPLVDINNGTALQVALGVVDMCRLWCGVYGSGQCHSPAPYFDSVKVLRVSTVGPQWSVRPVETFQDTFAANGTLTGTARADEALDIKPAASPTFTPGDSAVVFSLVDPKYVSGVGTLSSGLLADPNISTFVGRHKTKRQVYGYFTVTPFSAAKIGPAISEGPGGQSNRYPYMGTVAAGGKTWAQVRMDYTYTGSIGVPDPGGNLPYVANRFNVDLNDNLFTPGDTVSYFYSASSLDGTNYFSTEFGTTTDINAIAANPMEFTILPAGGYNHGGSILYVDGVDGLGNQPYWDGVFMLLGGASKIDRFDVRDPSTGTANRPASRVANVAAQLNAAYKVILWDTGTLSHTVGDGSGNPIKTDDYAMLNTFLGNLTQRGGVYLGGDRVAEFLNGYASASAATFRGTYMPFTLINANHRLAPSVFPISPAIKAWPGRAFTSGLNNDFIAFGGCPQLNDFDVIGASGPSRVEMSYNTASTPNGAVLSNSAGNAGVMMSGFSFAAIRDDELDGIFDRALFLRDMLVWMGQFINTDAGDSPDRSTLSQNYPNPFNPQTTIAFSIAQRANVYLAVYDVSGALVRTLANEDRPAGAYELKWDGRDDKGRAVASGVYFYKLNAGSFTQTKKMVLLK